MKKLNRGLFVMLAAVTLLTAALVTSCLVPFEGAVQKAEEDNFIPYDPPAGMGYIRVKLSNSARTITPTIPDIADLYYRVLVTDNNSNPVGAIVYDTNDLDLDDDDDPDNLPVEYDELSANPILLLPGNYTVTVTAYTSTATATIVGSGEDDDVDVANGGGNSVTISLSPNKASGNGKFVYNVTLPTNLGAATATITVTPYPSGTPIVGLNNVDLKTTSNNTATPATINSGFYYVKIIMTDSTQALQDRTVTNILHIYQNMTSTYTTGQLANLNTYTYTVTYDANTGTLAGSSTVSAIHGSTLIAPSNPTHATYTFNSWNRGSTTVSATSGWIFGTSGTKVISDLTLYAIWNHTEPVTLIIDWANPSNPVLTSATGSITQIGYYTGVLSEVTISFSNLNGYHVVGWLDSMGATLTGTGNTLVLTNDPDDTVLNYLVKGTHNITISLEDGDGVPQSLVYTLTVN